MKEKVEEIRWKRKANERESGRYSRRWKRTALKEKVEERRWKKRANEGGSRREKVEEEGNERESGREKEKVEERRGKRRPNE
jgi:hypothetical protein